MENKKYTIGKRIYNIALILTATLTIYLLFMFFYTMFFSNLGEEDNYSAELVVYIFKYLTFVGIPSALIITFIDLIGVIFILIFKVETDVEKEEKRKTLIRSIILLVLPLLTILFLYLICFVLSI